jgi:hypothetical protein
MDQIQIHQSIFTTNAFASEFPTEHTRLWYEFESEVPLKDRSGVYGSDNVAYIKWLVQKKDPAFEEFQRGIIKRESKETMA